MKRQTLLAAALLFLVPVFFFRKVIFYGYTLWPADHIFVLPPWSFFPPVGYDGPYNHFLFDNIFVFYPWLDIASDMIRSGSLPLWNPYISCGWPFFANSTGFFFPLNIVFYILPVWYAFGVMAVLKIFFAGLFTYLYVRRLLQDNFASFVSAIAFMLSAFMMGWLGHPHTYIAILLPLFFLLSSELVKKGGLLYPSLLSLTTGAALLGGHYETTFHVLFPTLLYFLFCIFYHRPQRPFYASIAFSCALMLGILVAAVQILPSWEYIQQSSLYIARDATGGGWSSIGAFFASLNGLATLFVPDFYGNPVDRNEWGDFAGLPNYIEQGGYVGVATVFLAFFAATGLYKDKKVILFTALSVLSLAVVHRLLLLTDFINALPVFSKLNNNRIILVWCFSVSVLAGYGTKYLIELQQKRRMQLAIMMSFSILLASTLWYIIAHGGFSNVTAMHGLRDYISDKIWLFLVFSFITILAIFLYTEGLLNKLLFQCLIILVMLTDLFLFGTKLWPSNNPQLLFPSTPAIEFLKKDKEVFRTYAIGNVMTVNTWTVYRFQDIRGYDGITLKDYERFITGKSGDIRFYMGGGMIPRHINLMNVKYVITPPDMMLDEKDFNFIRVYTGEVNIYRNEGYMPRAFVVYGITLIKDKNGTLNYMYGPAFDPSKEVVMDALPPEWSNAKAKPLSAVRIVKYEPDRIKLEAETESSGILVLTDTFYPGWKAYVNGEETPVYRADYMFRAIALKKGKHAVEFRYEPKSFRIGMVLSVAVTSAMAIILVFAFIRQRKGQK